LTRLFSPSLLATSRRRRIVSGGGATTLAQLSSALAQIVIVPFFLKFWGVQLYGSWLVLTTVPAYFAMSDIGFATVAANDMTMRVARGDQDGALETFQSVWVLVTVVSLAVLIVLDVCVWWLPFERWLNASAITHRTAASAMSLMLFHGAINTQGATIAAAFQSVGMYARSTLFGAAFRSVESVAIILSLAAGCGPTGVALSYLIVRCCALIIFYRHLRAHHPVIRVGVRRASLIAVRRLVGHAVAFLGFPLGNAVTAQGIVTAIGVLMGPLAVVAFSTVRTLVNAGRQVVSIITSTFWPEISMAYGAGNLEATRRLYKYAYRSAVMIAAAGAVVTIFAGRAIVEVWTGGKVMPDQLLVSVMSMGIPMNALWAASLVIPCATNRHQQTAALYVACTVLSVILAGILIPFAGLQGAAVATVLCDTVIALIAFRKAHQLLALRVGTT
jgi:O-antigen/teichoic acid export membrane protein